MKKLPPASSASTPPGAPTGEASSPVSSSAQLSTLNPQPPSIPDHELLRRIGGGSYGEVWLARNTLGAYRAVKIVHRITFDHDRPFEREFAGIQKFEPISRSHEGLVDLLQVGRNDAEGYFYYVMELADDDGERSDGVMESWSNGKTPSPQHSSTPALQDPSSYSPKTLRSLLRPNPQPSTLSPQPTARLPLDECIQLGLSLTNALAYLHGQGLVHRDIKPSNIIFVGGVPKLADVGLVAGVDEARSYVGTEGFIPPEGPGSTQADLYSLGILLYVMSTGKSHQDFPEPLADFASQPDHARWLEFNTVIHKACRAQVRERYQTADKMHADLELLCAGRSVKRLHLVERRLAVLTRVSVLTTLVAVIAAGVFYQTIRERKIATRSLVRSNVATGSRLMNEGDLFGALLSFTAALQLDAGDARREEAHRIRIASVLRQCPKLVGVFAHAATINQAGFSPDSRLVITASDDNTAQVWDLATGRPRLTLGHRGPVLNAAFSPDAKRIATTGSDNRVRFWNADTGKSLETHPIRHVARYDALPPQFSPDGLRIITVIQPMDLQIWNVVTGETIGQPLRHDREVTGFTFSPDGRYVFTVGGDNRVRLWDATTAALLPTDFEHVGLGNGAFSPDGRILATGGHDDLAHLWDLTAGKELPPPLQHRDWVTSVAFSPESDRLVTASRDNTVEVWDLATHPSPLRPLVQEARVFGANFSPDGRRIVTASQGNQVRMWDADSSVLHAPLLKHDTALGPVLFSPDGHLILTLQRAEAVRVWDLAVLEPPPVRIRPIASYSEKSSFSSDAQFKATISPRDNTIRTFEVSSGKPLTQPLTQTPPFRQAFFGSDNAILVTENADSHARIWELATGEPLTPLLKTCYDPNAPKLSKAVLAQQNSLAGRLPAAELVLLAQLLSGSQMDERGGIRPLERSDVASAWEKLTKICPEMFTDSASEVFAWHDQEARACEQAWDWWSARFHLEYLLPLWPDDKTLLQRHAYTRLALDSARKKAKGHQEQMREIPPRDPLSAPETVDLSDFYNLSLKTPSKNDLADLPAGLRDFGRTRFDVRGILQLSGQMDAATGTNYPHRINGIKIGRKCKRFHFLHASSFEAQDGTEVGSYVVHCADNQTEVIPIKYGKDVRSWWTVPGEPLDTRPSALIWMGTNPHAQSIKSRSLRLFKSSWANPRPDVQVVSFDFVSSSDNAGPFLVAITTE